MPRLRPLYFLLLGLVLAGLLRAQDDVNRSMTDLLIGKINHPRDGDAPKLDPKRIINESAGFLKEREPDMNADEYAVYERVVAMLASRPEFALKLLEAMTAGKEQPSPAFQFILGNAYYANGDYVRAEGSYRDAVKRYPTFLRAWSNLGVLYYTTKRYPDAIRCLSKCISLGERDPNTYGLLGYSLEQEKKIVSAEMAYMQALSADPGNADWLEGLLRLYVRGRQFGRAEWLVKDLIRQRPDDARYWLTYAEVLANQDRKLEAIAILEVCVGSGLGGATELEQLAGLYAEQRLVPEAIDTYLRLLRVTPRLGEQKLLTFAEVLVGHGRLDQAERVFTALSSQVSPAGRGSYQLAHAGFLVARQRLPQAREEYEALLRSEPLNGRALLGLGRVFLAEENLSRAQFTFEAAAQVPDTAYRASLELATLELKNRHYDKTVQHLERALALERTPAVQDLLARVRPLAERPQ